MHAEELLPRFLIIGGMKCATTTLFRDLQFCPQVYIPVCKEPEILSRAEFDPKEAAHEYKQINKLAPKGSVVGDASTAYSKWPTHEHVPQRAMNLLGPDLKIIYLIRDPFERTLSHFRHYRSKPESPQISFSQFLKNFPEAIDYSCYGLQLQRWMDVFSPENFLVIPVRQYQSDRSLWVSRVCEHIDVPAPTSLPIEDKIFNQSEGRPVSTGLAKIVLSSSLYQKFIRPRISANVRDFGKRFLKKSPAAKGAFSKEEQEAAEQRFLADSELLYQLTKGAMSRTKFWNRLT